MVVRAFFGIAFLWDWKVIPVKPVENTIIAPLDCLCPFVKGQLTVFIGVSHVFGAGISLFSSSRKLIYFDHGPGGNGEFLKLPSGSCYGNSSAGQEASVSILPAAK